MATWGIVTGYVATVLLFIMVFGAIFLAPRLIAQQRVAHQKKCIENLQLIQGYKEEWALQSGRPATAVPREKDLFGPGKYLETKPSCPAGGMYFLNAIQDSPYCTVHGTIRW